MENDFLIEIIKNFFNENPPPYFAFDYSNKIPFRKLKTARKLYAKYNETKEIPLLLIDDTFFRSAKLGLLMTNSNIYFRLLEDYNKGGIRIGNVSLKKISNIDIRTHNKGADLFINEKKVGFFRVLEAWGTKQTEADILNKLFEILIQKLSTTPNV